MFVHHGFTYYIQKKLEYKDTVQMSHRMGYKITHVAFNNNINDCDYHLYSALVFTKYSHIINLLRSMRGGNYCKSEAKRGEVIHTSAQTL